jgi:thiol-disulfide isomerase/thioredoxin
MNWQVLFPQDRKFSIQLDGIRLDSLYLIAWDHDFQKTIIKGNFSDDRYNFRIPDSTYFPARFYTLQPKLLDFKNKIAYALDLYSVQNNDTLYLSQFLIEDNQFFNAKYRGETVEDSVRVRYTMNNGRDTSFFATTIDYQFTVYNEIDRENYLRSKLLSYSWFYDESKSYEEQLQEHRQLASENPDSRFLISTIAGNVIRYKTKEDLQSVYELFTDSIKNSFFGLSIRKYLESPFENLYLIDGKNESEAPVIVNRSKPNLVIFSASWCKPCMEEVPVLKKIHADLQDKLEMVYVSMDDERTVANWKVFMEKENIEWRSVLGYKDVKKVEKTYHLNGIPQCVLVYPDGKFENMDVRKKEDLEKLYLL